MSGTAPDEAGAGRDAPGGVAAALAAVQERIATAARRVGRDPDSVTLVGVSKRVAPERAAEAVLAGLRHLGENYVQEATAKREALEARGDLPRVRWHMIGPLQRNKAREAVARFDVVESLDRESLARELDRRAEAAGRMLDVLVQVNVSGERQKSGCAPDALGALLATLDTLPRLRVRGLMTVPAAADDPEQARPAFARLRALRDAHRDAPGGAALHELSMGMSADFEVAIEEGATLVRVGTALFGPRDTPAGR